ncbi:MAG: hypothetical protein M3539_08860 [Acidobacteriota bacterium]|nr:hypothetical protein [Acidobacteriota bacterium]
MERWETTNKTFKVRVTAYGEEDWIPAPAGAYYVFESAFPGSENWKEIISLKHDDPVRIPREQVRFVSDQIGYVFMVYQYAVTTDSGVSWSTWDIVKDLPNWQSNRTAIEEVQIGPDGNGMMTLTPYTNDPKITKLYTNDYGRHWNVPEK